MKQEHPLIGMVIRKCVFLILLIKTLFYVGYLAILVLEVTKKRKTSAKSVLDLPHAKVGVPYNDFKHCINQYILSSWQDDWNGAVANKLYFVKVVLVGWQSSYRRCRKGEIDLCRARIGHTHLTHS